MFFRKYNYLTFIWAKHVVIFQRALFCAVLGAARTKGRFRSSYVGSLARRVRDTEEATDAAYLRELYHKNDPEAVIRLFEGQPSLHSNPAALSEYVKALVKVDRLDESELLRTLQRGETL